MGLNGTYLHAVVHNFLPNNITVTNLFRYVEYLLYVNLLQFCIVTTYVVCSHPLRDVRVGLPNKIYCKMR